MYKQRRCLLFGTSFVDEMLRYFTECSLIKKIVEKVYQYGFDREIVRNKSCTKSIIQLVIFFKTASENDATKKFLPFLAILNENISLLIERETFQPIISEIGGIMRAKFAKLEEQNTKQEWELLKNVMVIKEQYGDYDKYKNRCNRTIELMLMLG